jgi:exopolysaccharide biosynthesis polyprenyl glycosylphosphotransferase
LAAEHARTALVRPAAGLATDAVEAARPSIVPASAFMRQVLRRPAASAQGRPDALASALDEPLRAPHGLVEPPVRAVVGDGIVERRTLAWQRRLVRTLIGLDFLAAALAAVLAVTLRFGSDASLTYQLASLALPFVWVSVCAMSRAYEPRFLGTGSEEFRRVFDAGVRLLAVCALVSLALRLSPARLYVLLALPTAVGLSLLLRYAARQRLHRQRAAGKCLHKVVVVGRERSCAELVRQLRRESHAGFSVIGACVDRSSDTSIEGVPVVGSSTSIVEALRRTGADTVAVGAWSDLTQSDLRRLSWELEGSGVALVVAPSLTDIAGPRIHIRPVSGLPLLHVEEPEFSGGRRLLKGSVDRGVATAAVLALLPLLLALALAVRLTSRGPAFFRQTRVGEAGRTFTMLKLRSMYVDAEQRLAELQECNENGDGLLFKMRDDPRVTPLGRWLRRYSLDELPQLINIARGDMSLVGPRPPLPREVAQYGDDVRRRLLVKPGLTGLWQISGRSDLSWDESVRLDLHYVENWSLALDFMILWKTLFAVLGRKGAY